MSTPTPMPGEFPDDVERMLESIDQVLREAAATTPPADAEAQAPLPAAGSQDAGNGWGQFDASLRDLVPSCGAIYRTGGAVFVVCEREQGHEEKCSGEGYQWATGASLSRPGVAAAPSAPAAAPAIPAPMTEEEAEAAAVAALGGNEESSYSLSVTVGPFWVDPLRIEPDALNHVDRAMVANLLRLAAERLETQDSTP